MNKIKNYVMGRKGLLNAVVMVAGLTTMMARDGFCFFVFHQPKFPEALKDVE